VKIQLAVMAALGVLATALVTAAPQDKTALAFKPKTGQVLRYKAGMIVTAEGDRGARTTYDSSETRKITVGAISEAGDIRLDLETEPNTSQVFVNGQPSNARGGGSFSVAVKSDFSLVGYAGPRAKSAENLDTRLYRAITPGYPATPVGVKDTWSREFRANAILGTRGAHAEFEVLGSEVVRGVDCLKVKWAYEELEGVDPMSFKGTGWFDKASGAIVKVDGLIANLPVDAKGKIKQEQLVGK